jgi:hypothetical protein
MVWYWKGHIICGGPERRWVNYTREHRATQQSLSTLSKPSYIKHARSRPSPTGNYGNLSWCVLCISKKTCSSHVSTAAFSTYERELNCMKCSLQTLPRIPDFSHLKALEHREGPIPQDVICTSIYVTVIRLKYF